MCAFLFHVLLTVALAADGLARHAIIESNLAQNYSRVILPNYDSDGPVNVLVKVIIHSMDSISEATMDYSVTIYLRQWWIDPRLAYPHSNISEPLQLDVETIAKLWVPDVFFVNEKRGAFHDVTVPNKLLHIYKNGSIFYSTRLSLTLSCYMDLRKYPLDSQNCPLQIESYSYTAENLMLFWVQDDPVERKDGLELPHFHMKSVKASTCHRNYTSVGRFTCLRANMSLSRNIGFYIIQVYVPSFLIVVLSWVSFWLNVDAVPARISLGVLTVLTVTTQTSGLSATLPKVSYIKALDIWMAMCLAFVFAALLEFSVVNVYTRGGAMKVNVDFRNTIRSMRTYAKAKVKSHGEDTKPVREAEEARQRSDFIDSRRAGRIDKFARKAFPLLFLCLNLVYWLVLSFWQPDV